MDKDGATVAFYEFVAIVKALLQNVEKYLEMFDYTRAHCHFSTAEHAYSRAASLYFQYVTEWSPENGEQARSTLERIAGHIHGAHDVIRAGK